MRIVDAVREAAEGRGVSTSQVSLAWVLAKGANPIVVSTKPQHYEDAVKALALTLTQEEIDRMEAPYLSHEIVPAI